MARKKIDPNHKHKAIFLTHPTEQNYEAWIDEEIAPLIMACWQLKIDTRQCCQNYTEKQEAWIRFAGIKDAVKFFRITLPVANDMKWICFSPDLQPNVYFPHHQITILTNILMQERIYLI